MNPTRVLRTSLLQHACSVRGHALFAPLCRDSAGEDGASLLGPDELPIQLLPGPPAALVADCPQQLQCSTKGVLDTLPIKAVDAYGNLVDSCAFDVSRH